MFQRRALLRSATMAVLAVPYCGPRCSARAPDMVMIGNDADWPDWQDEKSYRYTRHLTRRGWAWEFLRRNPAFQRDCRLSLEQAEFAERWFEVEVVRSSLDLTQWGLLFRRLVEARCGCFLVLPPMPACSAAHCGRGIVGRNAFV
ncbi:transcriptional regulator domain-containing protein [Mesorhizobium amorphae]|uniref:transcriptional regulator domain-containing protein n=1 Tax=Mesorhizobium amorphae TaxID=71433 RepID=UPI003F4F7E91